MRAGEVKNALHTAMPAAGAPAVLYAVAHAGAGAAAWKAVAERLVPSIELRAYRLPGRENRLRVPMHPTLEAAAAELAEVISDDAADHGKPFLISGVCSGTLLGLAALAIMPPSAACLGLLSAGQPPPSVPVRSLSALPSAALRDWLRAHEATLPEVLDNDTLFGFFEPVLRADLRMAEQYSGGLGPIAQPLFLVRTVGEQLADTEIAQWSAETTGAVHVIDVPVTGDLLTSHPAELAAAIRTAQIAATASAAPVVRVAG